MAHGRCGLQPVEVERVSYEELIDIVKIWVNAALKLERKDLRMMQRLVSRQEKNALKNSVSV